MPDPQAQPTCFLCSPPEDLVFMHSENFVALAGLGPVVDGYCIVSAKEHVRSMADVPDALSQERDHFLNRIRSKLTDSYGNCLVTEHGRMAVCSDGDHDEHCYHAHFLLFPGAPDISRLATTYFSASEEYSQIQDALAAGAMREEYLLVSSAESVHKVFYGPLNIPRQLARHLVAWSIGQHERGDWRNNPNRREALEIANKLRKLFGRAE